MPDLKVGASSTFFVLILHAIVIKVATASMTVMMASSRGITGSLINPTLLLMAVA